MNIQLMTPADEVTENLIDNPSSPSGQENKPFKKKRRVFPLILIIVLLLAIGIGIYYFYIANRPKALKFNDFRNSISIDNTIYTWLINTNNTISKIENDKVSEFAALPENYKCNSLLYNENENLFYSLGSKDENNISDVAIFSLNEDGSVNQKIFHTSLPSNTQITNYYDDFQYIQDNFYAIHYDESNSDVPYAIIKITSEGNMEDFYSIKDNISEGLCHMIANNNSIYCVCQNKNKEVKLITLENVNEDMEVSESPFDSDFLYFYNCNDDYFTYSSFNLGEDTQDSDQKIMKYSINDKSTDELLSLNKNEYNIQNVTGDYIYYSEKQESENYNEDGISSFPVKLFKYNWKNKEKTGVLDKVFNPSDYGVTEKTTKASFSVIDVTDTGDKILCNLNFDNSSTGNEIYFICNSDGSDERLLSHRVTHY